MQATSTQEATAWLLDQADSGVRYLTYRDILQLDSGDSRLMSTRQEAHGCGPIAAVLEAMHPDGYWVRPGPGYTAKYRSTVWSLILLAQLGASPQEDARIQTACEYLMAHSLDSGGWFSENGKPAGTYDCLQGNLCTALLDLGVEPRRLEAAFDWMARTVTGEGLAPAGQTGTPLRYFANKSGPQFACGWNGHMPCAWGAVKVMLALGKLPPACRTPVIESAIHRGVEFLFSVDPLTAAYPTRTGSRPNRNWWKLGFPVFYVSDLLQVIEALILNGCARDPRLQNALKWLRLKADPLGRWPLEFSYAGRTWVNFGEEKAPNPWVTLRAVRALAALN